MATTISGISLLQLKPYTLPDAKVQVTFTLAGASPNLVQVYAQEPGSQQGNIVEATLVETIPWKSSDSTSITTIELQAGSVFAIWLCPRNENGGTLDDNYNGEYWEGACISAGNIPTKVPAQAPTNQPTKPYIVNISQEPATLADDGTITVSWVSSSYNKFLIWWTVDGQSLKQGEVDAGGSSDSATTGSWTTNQAVAPGAVYTFAVEGGTSQGFLAGYKYSGWGNTLTVTAVENDRSLVDLLNHSGINPAGLKVSSILGGQTSLKHAMKLT